MTLPNYIAPAIWFDNNAFEAFKWYSAIFPNSTYSQINPVVVSGKLAGTPFVGINGGAAFKPNSAISFLVTIESQTELLEIWHKLLEKSHSILMPLQAYPWSQLYAWIEDAYGVHWQLYLGKLVDVNNQVICPMLMYPHASKSICMEAVAFYKDLFPNLESHGQLHYPAPNENKVQHTQFSIGPNMFMAADHIEESNEKFTEGVSLVIYCKDQTEINYYWDKITAKGKESQCGWCKDEFGVSWQVIPENIDVLIANPNAQKALYAMKKIIIDELLDA